MDITIQMRSLDLLVKMIKREMEGVPYYGYIKQRCSTDFQAVQCKLPRCTPEEAGMSSTVVERLFTSVSDSTDALGVHGMMLVRHGKVFAEGFWAPYRADVPHMLYSASKSIVSTAIGMAVDEGLINIDERLEDIFTDLPHPPSGKWARAVTVRHLLTMSTGNRFNEVGSALDEDWVRMFMESAPKFEPGTQFEYNSLNTYMLAAVLHKKTGMGVVEYLTPRLFEPLGILNHEWETCPRGIEKGGWGLSLCLEDLAKIGQLYLQRGMWNGVRLLSEEWVSAATTAQIATPNGEMKRGYGFQIWMGEEGAYQFNGAFGQYAVMLPQFDALAVIFSGSTQLFAKTSLMQMLDSCFWTASRDPLPPYPDGYARLTALTSSLLFSPTPGRDGLAADARQFDTLADILDGREYRLADNYGSLFPQPLQNVFGCYSRGADIIRFRKTGVGLAITFYEHCERNTIYIRRDGGFIDSVFCMRDEAQLVSTRAVWRTDGDEICLTLFVSFIATPDTRVIELRLINESIEAVFDETPSAEGATRMLLELVGLFDEGAVKRLVPAMKHVPGFNENSINDLVKKYSAPRAFGKLIHCHDL